MSSTFFRIFGILVFALVVYAVLTRFSDTSNPVQTATAAFLNAVKSHDVTAVQQSLDTATAELMQTGDKVTGIRFGDVNIFSGAFSKRPSVVWSYSELADSSVDFAGRTEISQEERLASVPLTNGSRIYLRQQDELWKVFYIEKPKDGK